MYNLAIIELYNPTIHGIENTMFNHYFMTYKITMDEFMKNEHIPILNSMRNYYNNYIKNSLNDKDKNYMVENYDKIIKMDKYYSLQLVDPIIKNDVYGCILKTYALSIFQRKWRNYLLHK